VRCCVVTAVTHAAAATHLCLVGGHDADVARRHTRREQPRQEVQHQHCLAWRWRHNTHTHTHTHTTNDMHQRWLGHPGAAAVLVPCTCQLPAARRSSHTPRKHHMAADAGCKAAHAHTPWLTTPPPGARVSATASEGRTAPVSRNARRTAGSSARATHARACGNNVRSGGAITAAVLLWRHRS
jgi:hypothetical protein